MSKQILILPGDGIGPEIMAEAVKVLEVANTKYSLGFELTHDVIGGAAIDKHGVPLPEARSKSWDEFAAPGAPHMDFIFTVCASAAGEACPIWPGRPTTAHWGIADPAHIEPLAARREAFEAAYRQLARRIGAFVALPLETLSAQEVAAAARRIHEEGEA